jgi:hypothetical protein
MDSHTDEPFSVQPLPHQDSNGTSTASRATSQSGDMDPVATTTSKTSATTNEDKESLKKEKKVEFGAPQQESIDANNLPGKGAVEQLEDAHPPEQDPFIFPPEGGDVSDLSEPDEDPERPSYSYRPFSSQTRTLDERVRKAPKQVVQIVQYTKLMEERVQALEREVRELKIVKEEELSEKLDRQGDIADSLEAATCVEEKIPPPKLIPEARRAIWSDYSSTQITHSIDVLYGEPDNPAEHTKESSQKPATKIPSVIGANKRPSRIRIQSRLLRSELTKVTQLDIMYSTREVLAPFKPFVLFDTEIRKHQETLNTRLEELAAEHEKVEQTGDNNSQTLSGLQPDQTFEPAGSDSESSRDPRNKPTESSEDTPIFRGEALQTEHQAGDTIPGSEKPLIVSQASAVPETDVLPGEEGLNPQDIACLMLRCDLTRADAAYNLRTYLYYEDAMKSMLQFSLATEEEKERFEKRTALFEAKILIEEWKAVVYLLDNELAKTIEVRNAIKRGDLKEVGFDDLTYVFEPGQTVMTSGDKARMMRVFSMTGGRRLLNDSRKTDVDIRNEDSAVERQDKAVAALGNLFHATERFSPFVVDCFHFDFDGTQFGPVQTTFSIKKFDGLKKLVSLPIHPTNIVPNEAALKEKLLVRGRKFLELCSLDHVVHREYDGLSLDDPPEQIDSQVIIDFDMASRVGEAQQPKGNGWIPKLGLEGPTKADEREITEGSSDISRPPVVCGNPNCSICNERSIASPLLNDQVVDRKSSSAFLFNSKLLNGQVISVEDLNQDDLMLMPNRVLGFVLRSRKWGECFDLNYRKVADRSSTTRHRQYHRRQP